MKISHVLSAVNDNKKYGMFVRSFIKTWIFLFPDICPVVVYTGKNLDEFIINNDIPVKYVKYLKHFYIDGVDTCFTAQIIRLFYPALLQSSDFVLISDIDMIPLNRKYYENVDATKEQFICYRSDCLGDTNMYPICYNAAVPKKWSEIFQIFSPQHIEDQITYIYGRIQYNGRNNHFWYTDQFHLHYIISQRKDVLFLTDIQNKYYRLPYRDCTLPDFSKRIQNGVYNDYHMSKDCDLKGDLEIINTLIKSKDIY